MELYDFIIDYSGPSGLMARSESSAIVAVEVLIEQDQMRVLLKFPVSP